MTVRLLTVCGTGETPGASTNMLSHVARAVQAPVAWTDVSYPASIAVANPQGNLRGVSESASRGAGLAAIRRAVFSSPDPVILSGYSLGALVVSDFLEEVAASARATPPILAVVNIASPARLRGQSYGHPSFGFGLDGEHGPWPANVPVFEIANPVDVITSAPELSPWRQLAVALRSLTLSDLSAWWPELMRYLPEFRAQGLRAHWTNPQWWRAFAEAPAWLHGYLFDGQHTTAYGQPRWIDSSGQPVSGINLAARVITWKASRAAGQSLHLSRVP